MSILSILQYICVLSVKVYAWLCGECAKSYSLAVNSYSLDCKNSSAFSAYNWFLLVIIILSHSSGYFLHCHHCISHQYHIRLCQCIHTLYAQLVSMQINAMLLQKDWEVAVNSAITDPKLAYRISIALVNIYSVWNLGLGRSIYQVSA